MEEAGAAGTTGETEKAGTWRETEAGSETGIRGAGRCESGRGGGGPARIWFIDGLGGWRSRKGLGALCAAGAGLAKGEDPLSDDANGLKPDEAEVGA